MSDADLVGTLLVDDAGDWWIFNPQGIWVCWFGPQDLRDVRSILDRADGSYRGFDAWRRIRKTYGIRGHETRILPAGRTPAEVLAFFERYIGA